MIVLYIGRSATYVSALVTVGPQIRSGNFRGARNKSAHLVSTHNHQSREQSSNPPSLTIEVQIRSSRPLFDYIIIPTLSSDRSTFVFHSPLALLTSDHFLTPDT